ncbi:MAG: hypothetical protein IPI32_01700 [Austwickia sp.]|nr:hypothetical protein [Austwickia sp.]MBK8437675.1 hypothetical protein [Austwickia sp.]MBK9099986.1 hypothetical protein [Austwickia sp.]
MEWLRRLAVAGLAVLVVAAPIAVTAGSSARGTDLVVSRVTARTTPVLDRAGQQWAPAASSLTGARISTALAAADIAGTDDDALYQINAYGMSAYTAQLAEPGQYRVRLLMVETYWRSPDKRVFSVLAEGQPAVADLDLFAEAGYATAHERSFDVEVTDGTLNLTFVTQIDHPVISAIEIRRMAATPAPTATTSISTPTSTPTPTPTPTPTTSTPTPTSTDTGTPTPTPTTPTTTTSTAPVPLGEFAVRSVAGTEPVQDSAGRTWTSRTGLIGATRFNTTYVGRDVAGTADDPLYQVTAFDFAGFSTPVPAQGRYTVTAHFMEPYFTDDGRRVFDVTAEGRPVIADIDIHKAVGAGSAHQRSAIVAVRDGSLDLGFVRKIDFPLLTAVEVTYLDEYVDGPPAEAGPGTTGIFAHRETARDGQVTDGAGHVWHPRSIGWGSWRRSTALSDKPIDGTDDDMLYQVNGFGIGWYRLTVPAAATYRVRLLMAESYWTAPGARVFDVVAEGQPVATDVDIVAATGGPGVAHEVAFDVPVADGELNLTFPAKVDFPLVSAIEVLSTSVVAIPAATPGPRAVTFAPDSFWTQDISAAPTAPDSAAAVAELVTQVADRSGGVAAFNAYDHNASFHVVPAGQTRITVNFHDCQTKGVTPWGLFDGPGHFLDVPVPDDAIAAAGTDATMTIYDPAADQLWEFWQMQRNDSTNDWEACWGGRLDAVSTRQGYFPMYFGASATGTVIAGGMITLEDVRRGEINHAISVAALDTAQNVYSWPGQRTDGSLPAGVLMEGQRLRLDPALDLSQYAMTPIGRMVAKAAQRYGFVVTDRSGVVALSTESGLLQASRTGVNPWDTLLAGQPYEALRNFPWASLQALPKDWGKPA